MSIENDLTPNQNDPTPTQKETRQNLSFLEQGPTQILLDKIKSQDPEIMQKIEVAKSKINSALRGREIEDADWVIRICYIDSRGKNVPGHGWDHVNNPDKDDLKFIIDNPVRKNQTTYTIFYGTDSRDAIEVEGYHETNAEFYDNSEGGAAVIREYDVEVTQELDMLGIKLARNVEIQYRPQEGKFTIFANKSGYWSLEVDNI